MFLTSSALVTVYLAVFLCGSKSSAAAHAAPLYFWYDTLVSRITFDVYTGKGVDSGKKSLAFRIVMQDTQRTLQDTEVEAGMQELIACLSQEFAAQLRA